MFIFKKKKPTFEAAPVPVTIVANSAPHYIKPVALTVEETWETPDSDQYDFAYQEFLKDLQNPIEAIEATIREKTVQFRCTMERMVEIAPDFFEKALRRSAFQTGYFIDKEDDHDQ